MCDLFTDVYPDLSSDSELVNSENSQLYSYVNDLSANNIIESDISSVSFGNRYDDNTIDFLKDCQTKGVEFPPYVDHDTRSTITEVDRSINGGLTNIDKSIMRDYIEQDHSLGRISDADYNKLLDKLDRC